MNRPEELTNEALISSVAQHDALVYPKIRIADALSIDSSGITNEEYSYALKAHFDFVVSRKGSRIDFAVEFDGPLHESSKQTMKRDELKRSICNKLGMPLLRVDYNHLKQIGKQTIVGWLAHLWYIKEDWDHNRPADPFAEFNYSFWFKLDPRAIKAIEQLLSQGFTYIDGRKLLADSPEDFVEIRKLCRPTIDTDMDPFIPYRLFLSQTRDDFGFTYSNADAVDSMDYWVALTIVEVGENERIIGSGRSQINPGWPVTGLDVSRELSMVNASEKLKKFCAGEIPSEAKETAERRLAELRSLNESG